MHLIVLKLLFRLFAIVDVFDEADIFIKLLVI